MTEQEVEITIKVPEDIAFFLERISDELDMTIGQFLTKILATYSEVYDIAFSEGVDHGRDECEECPGDDE